jgi:hypothetical protein
VSVLLTRQMSKGTGPRPVPVIGPTIRSLLAYSKGVRQWSSQFRRCSPECHRSVNG